MDIVFSSHLFTLLRRDHTPSLDLPERVLEPVDGVETPSFHESRVDEFETMVRV